MELLYYRNALSLSWWSELEKKNPFGDTAHDLCLIDLEI